MITDYINYWPLNEGSGSSSTDTTGGRTLALASGATWISGNIGAGALRFNKTANGHASFTSLDLGTTHSVACWFWVRDTSSSADGVVIGGSSGSYALYFDNTSLYYSAGTGNFGSVGHGGLAALRTWNHFVVTRSLGVVDFYLNGTKIGLTSNLNFPTNTLSLDTFGSYNSFNFPSQVDLDDVRFYNRVLSAADVAELAAYTGSGSIQLGGATLSGNGTMSLVASKELRGSVSLSASGSVTSLGNYVATGSVAASGIAIQTSAGQRTQQSSVTASATGTATIGAQAERRSNAALSAQSDITTTGSAERRGSVSLSGNSDWVAGASGQTQFGVATFNGQTNMLIAGQLIAVGQALPNASGDATFSGRREVSGSMIISGSSNASATGGVERRGSFLLRATANLSVDSIRETFGSVQLNGVGSLGAVGVREALGALGITASGGMLVVARRETNGSVNLTGSSSLNATGNGGNTPIYTGSSRIYVKEYLGRRTSGGLGSRRVLSSK